MERKSKTLLVVVIISLVISIGYTFYKTIIKNDFSVTNMPLEETSGLE